MKPENSRKLTFWTYFTAEVVLSLVTFVVCFAIFFYLTREVFLVKNQGFDQEVFSWAARYKSEQMTDIVKFVTYFASVRFLVSVPSTLTLFFLFFRKWRWFAVYIFMATVLSAALNQYLKNTFGRMRPESAFYFQSGFSFPSGHAMIGIAFYGTLAYLAWKYIRNPFLRYALPVLLITWTLLIAFSRVYLNVHYATDVLAGLAAGMFCMVLTIFLVRQLQAYYARRNGRISASKTKAGEETVE